MPKSNQPSYQTAFSLFVILFFMWAFLTEMNGVLVPFVKKVFDFGYTQAILVQFCFFIAFALMAIPASRILDRIGYRKGIILGLCTMAVGCLLFVPASMTVMFPLFLGALFILATGVTMLQVAANPYVAVLGAPEKAASRLNLAQGFNSVAKTIAPFFGAYFILKGLSGLPQAEAAAAVQMPYVGLAIALLAVALIFFFIPLPDIKDLEGMQDTNSETDKRTIWDFPHLKLGAIAIFMYVGAEVAVASYMINFAGLDHIAGLEESEAGRFLSFYWGGLMVGRFLGAGLLQTMKSHALLAFNAVLAIVLLIAAVMLSGPAAMWCLIILGLCNSIMWGNIFTLAIDGLGPLTAKGSGLLVTAIVGGAVVPLLMGILADTFGLQPSYLLLVGCYGYILFYGLKGYAAKA
ncbi:MAG: FHS family L-fucose permease-like MFS transporter [Polaribacter sp.]|jgi:FHS family L-fucose permease-like MFS transporter